MKTILPWILAVAFAAGAGALYFSNSNKDAELAKAREQVQQVETLRSQVDDLQKQAASQTEQMDAMHKDTDELLRLRNEVRRLTDEKQQMTKQLEASQAAMDRSQTEAQQAQARATANATALAEQRILQMKQNESVVSSCISYLRQLDGAKQQWAMQNNKPADAVPSPTDLLPFLPNHQMPQCPGGGRYTLNAVNIAPTCSIPGHVLQ